MRSQDIMPSPLALGLVGELWKIHEFRSGKIIVVLKEDLFGASRKGRLESRKGKRHK